MPIRIRTAKEDRGELQSILDKMKASVAEKEWELFSFHFGEYIEEAIYPGHPERDPETGEYAWMLDD